MQPEWGDVVFVFLGGAGCAGEVSCIARCALGCRFTARLRQERIAMADVPGWIFRKKCVGEVVIDGI